MVRFDINDILRYISVVSPLPMVTVVGVGIKY
jgi:hypothetical protein